MGRLKFTISKTDGSVVEEASGFRGKACQEISAKFKGLGDAGKEILTPEFYTQEQSYEQHVEQQQ